MFAKVKSQIYQNDSLFRVWNLFLISPVKNTKEAFKFSFLAVQHRSTTENYYSAIQTTNL